MRFAYADPPYPRQAKRLYGNHPDYAGEVDHRELIDRLVAEYPDGWALSTSAQALQEVLALCPTPKYNRENRQQFGSIRVCAWVKPGLQPMTSPLMWGWEAVIVVGGRYRLDRKPRVKDWLVAPARGIELIGAKPRAFCHWLFDLLGAEPGDELDDLFPGSGAVGLAWRQWTGRPPCQGEQAAFPLMQDSDGR